MRAVLASANGCAVRRFENCHPQIVSALDEPNIRIQRQVLRGLAGPNDTLQWLLEWETIARCVAGIAGTTLVSEIVKDLYKHKASILKALGSGADALLRKVFDAVREAASFQLEGEEVWILLGIESEALKRRNIGLVINGMSEDEVWEAIIIASFTLPQIRAFVEDILEVENNEEAYIEGGVFYHWEENPDCSLKVNVEKMGAYIDYVEVTITISPRSEIRRSVRKRFGHPES